MTTRCSISPLQAAVIRAFLPGPLATLRSIKSTEWQSLTFSGERIEIEFDLANEGERQRAFRLVKTAPEMEVHGLPGAIMADVAAQVRDDVLHVECLVVED